ncbi:hypothetical protein NQ317_018972 [Molorchus minor]|uniref:Uncharacterized protein n=1 Tax=Molorchus minor TaxID=1323400 RepID=A0ABQ9JJK8_9CUCU|nr:hypothetical protein NQ317_018972 [Molorchus minor]
MSAFAFFVKTELLLQSDIAQWRPGIFVRKAKERTYMPVNAKTYQIQSQHTKTPAQGFAAELAPKYSVPYTVIRIISPVVYDLKSANGKRLKRVHVRKTVTDEGN